MASVRKSVGLQAYDGTRRMGKYFEADAACGWDPQNEHQNKDFKDGARLARIADAGSIGPVADAASVRVMFGQPEKRL